MDLDNLEEIKKIDQGNFISLLANFPNQLEEALGNSQEKIAKLNLQGEFKNIVCCGMGGSALFGDFLKSCLRDEISLPIEVCRGYHLPKFIDKDSLVLVDSYSGDTAESLSAFGEAKERGCQIVCFTSNGKLKEMAETSGTNLVLLPTGLTPRQSFHYSVIYSLALLNKLGLISDKSGEIMEAINITKKQVIKYSSDVKIAENSAKTLAQKIFGKISIIYTASDYKIAALKWKIDFNETAKTIAFYNVFSELNHNEINGWEHPKELTKNFIVIYLRNDDDPERIKKRFDITKKIINPYVAEIIEIYSGGEGKLTRLFSSIILGSFISFYLAILNKTDPTPALKVEFLKRELGNNY